MPSPLGHALAGLSIALAADTPDPPIKLDRTTVKTLLWAATLAAIPDADLLLHVHRTFTHSIGATALVTIVAAAVTGQVTGRVNWRIAITLGAAYGSHLVLDWLGTDPLPPGGIQVFWPFDQHFYKSNWDIFPPTERRWSNPAIVAINLRALVVETVLMGPVAAAAWAFRRRRKSRGPTSVRDVPRQPSASGEGTDDTSDRRGRRAAR